MDVVRGRLAKFRWDKLKNLHELKTTYHMDEAWKMCSTINAAIDEQWNTLMGNFREDLKQLNSNGWSVADGSQCQETRTSRSKYDALYNHCISKIYKWFREVMGQNCGNHLIGPVELMPWIEEGKPLVKLVSGPKTPPKASPQNQSHGFPSFLVLLQLASRRRWHLPRHIPALLLILRLTQARKGRRRCQRPLFQREF